MGIITRCPSLVMLSPSTLKQKMAALSTILQLPASTDVVALVKRQPSLLCLSTDLLQAKVMHLGQVLGAASHDQACSLATSNPAILTLGVGTLERKLCLLGAAVDKAAAQCSDPGTAMHLPAEWQAQLASAAPTVRAALACFSEQRYSRLLALAAAVKPTDSGRFSLSSILRMSDSRFQNLLSKLQATEENL